MNQKNLKTGLCAFGALTACAGITAFLIAPGKASKQARAPFFKHNFAHRGLHTPDKTVPENSLPAFAEAARFGYGIELDVHLTRDGRLVVFHDDNTERICAVDAVIADTDWSVLKNLRLCKTEYGIPLLSEVLETVGRSCPVVIELKRGARNTELCEKTYAMMRQYGGRYCVESFDPRIVAWFRRNAPEVLRGQLASEPKKLAEGTSRLSAFAVGNLLTNVLARPQFIAYGLGRKPLLVRLSEKMGAMKVAWVSNDSTTEADNDAVIFEFYKPSTTF